MTLAPTTPSQTITTRRGLLAGAAVALAPTAALAGVPARADDARLHHLYAQLQAARARLEEWAQVERDASDAYQAVLPPMGEALRITAEDCREFGGGREVGDTFGGVTVIGFRERLPSWRLHAEEFNGPRIRYRIRRAEEVIAAWDEWEAAHELEPCATAVRQVDAAEEGWDAAHAEVGCLESEVLATPAHTVAGLRIKASVCAEPDADVAHVLAALRADLDRLAG